MIETHNNKPEPSSFTLGHNQFSDQTHDEFQRLMGLGPYSPELHHSDTKVWNFMKDEEAASDEHEGGLRGAPPAAVATERRLSSTFTPDDNGGIDWHFKGLIGPVRNQGLCGACWAFSAIGSIESSMAIDKFNDMTPDEQRALSESKMSAVSGETLVDNDLGLVVPLSEQNLIDCDTLREKGCEGGLMVTDFDEEEVKNGVCAEADYPYLPPDPGNLRLFDVHPRPRLHSQGPRRHRPPKDKQPRRRPQGEAGHGRDGRERPHVPVLLLGSIHERHLWEGHEGDGNTGLQDALPRAGRLPPRHQPRRSCGGVRYGQDRGGRRAEGLLQGEEQLG
mmetsp:Transcript_11466/g.26904  ORF Transcript_11466/g.26904 Transcript_11466/m.26904 type:complete len:334 (+) Transcript_11466:153-1154(+)